MRSQSDRAETVAAGTWPPFGPEVEQAAAEVHSVDAFREWSRCVIRRVMPHGALACGHGRIHAAGVAPDYVLAVDFPMEHFDEICNPAGGIDTPLMRRWLSRREPVAFNPADCADWPEISAAWLERFHKNDLRNAAVHAVFDTDNYVGTYFSFHRLPRPPGGAEIEKLKMLAPLMHTTLSRVVRLVEMDEQRRRPHWKDLTVREMEVATWVGRGKANQDIAQIVGLQESTVKHHVTGALRKLNFENRSQLAAAITRWPPGLVTRGTRVL